MHRYITINIIELPIVNFHRNEVIELYLHILTFIKFKVTLKHYGQLGSTISNQKDIEQIERFF